MTFVNTQINWNFTLTIFNLVLSDDSGEYFCESWANDTLLGRQLYYVTIAGGSVFVVGT